MRRPRSMGATALASSAIEMRRGGESAGIVCSPCAGENLLRPTAEHAHAPAPIRTASHLATRLIVAAWQASIAGISP